MLGQLLPKVHRLYRSLPVFGHLLEEFAQWSRQRGYTLDAIRIRLFSLKRVAHFFARSGVQSLKEVIPENFEAARRHLDPHVAKHGGAILTPPSAVPAPPTAPAAPGLSTPGAVQAPFPAPPALPNGGPMAPPSPAPFSTNGVLPGGPTDRPPAR